jgi:anti-sigma B factor antagonist
MDNGPRVQLTVQVVHLDAAPVVLVAGELDLSTADSLRTSLEPLGGRVVVNLAGVTFMDCSGVSVLVEAHNRLVAEGGGLRVRSPSVFVVRLLELLGMGDWIVREARPCVRRRRNRSRRHRAAGHPVREEPAEP